MWFCKIIRACDVLSPPTKFFLVHHKEVCIGGVDYLKFKNDAIHCKTIIFDKSQIHAAPNFSLINSSISSYVTITCYTLLQQGVKERIALGDVGRLSFLIMTLNDFSVLRYDVLSSFRLYNIQFKKVKILWESGAKGRIWGLGAG